MGREQRPERGIRPRERRAHDHGGQHERHQHADAQHRTSGEPEARHQVGHGQPRRQRQRGGHHGLPRGEPDHVAESVVAEHAADLEVGRAPIPRSMPAGSRRTSPRRRAAPRRAPGRPLGSSAQHQIGPPLDPIRSMLDHVLRRAATAGHPPRHRSVRTARGARVPSTTGIHEHAQRHVPLERRREQEVDHLTGFGGVRRARQHARVLHLAVAAVRHDRGRCRIQRLLREDHLGDRAGSRTTPRSAGHLRHRPRPRTRRSRPAPSLRPRGRRWLAVAPNTTPTPGRRNARSWRAGRPARASTSPDSAPR